MFLVLSKIGRCFENIIVGAVDVGRSAASSVLSSEEFLWKTLLMVSFCSLNRAEAAVLERKSFFRKRALTLFLSTC